MTWLLLALVLVFLAAAGTLLVVLLRTRHDLEQGRRQIAAAEEQARDAEQRSMSADERVREAAASTDRERQRADHAEYRAAQAEGRLALSRQQGHQDSGADTANQPARPGSSGGPASQEAHPASDGVASLEALWSLALLEQERAWRLTMAAPAATAAGRPRGLAEVLDTEMSRIREEAGTPGRLHWELAEEPPPAVAVVALRAVEAMLGAITRYSDAYDLYLSTAGQELAAVLVCENFDGPDVVADDASAVYRAVAPVGGSLDIGHDKQDRLEARLRVPLRPVPG